MPSLTFIKIDSFKKMAKPDEVAKQRRLAGLSCLSAVALAERRRNAFLNGKVEFGLDLHTLLQ